MVLAATSNPEIEIYYEKFVKSKFHKKNKNREIKNLPLEKSQM